MPPHDTMTIAESLSWARTEHARTQRAAAETTAAAAARRREIQQQLDSLVAVMVVDKSFLPKNPDLERYQDFISLTFAYRNRGTKSIQAFQGDVSFLDATGDTIYSAHLKVDGPIAPGKTAGSRDGSSGTTRSPRTPAPAQHAARQTEGGVAAERCGLRRRQP